jgi:hypothetical protein
MQYCGSSRRDGGLMGRISRLTRARDRSGPMVACCVGNCAFRASRYPDAGSPRTADGRHGAHSRRLSPQSNGDRGEAAGGRGHASAPASLWCRPWGVARILLPHCPPAARTGVLVDVAGIPLQPMARVHAMVL